MGVFKKKKLFIIKSICNNKLGEATSLDVTVEDKEETVVHV